MSRKTYAVGDMIVVRAGLTRTATADRTCKIVGILPADHREAQYRVRFATENFERRIVETDIETSETVPEASAGAPAPADRGGPWLRPLSVRPGK